MPASLAPSTRSRLTSLSLVAALHGLIVLGLSAGLLRDALQAPPGPTRVRVVDEPTLPPPQPVPLPPQMTPRVAPPVLAPVPVPPIAIEPSANATSALPLSPETPALRDPLPATRSADPSPVAASTPQAAGLLCPTQVRPQLPSLASEGSAHLRVVGTVRGGRVVAVQLHTLQALPERRAQRALLAEVEQTLRSGYACSQDGVFEQEFLFRVE